MRGLDGAAPAHSHDEAGYGGRGDPGRKETELTRFLDDPRISLNNNLTERGLRGVVLGRKDHYGSRPGEGPT